MPLNLYRRHSPKHCQAGHSPNLQTYESDELRPKWRKCVCPIFASGKLADNPKFRKNTGCFQWSDARLMARQWEAGNFQAPPVEPAPAAVDQEKPRKTITEAVAGILAVYAPRPQGHAHATWRRMRRVLGQVEKFSRDVKGYVYLDQWDTDDVHQFLAWWTGCSERTSAQNLTQLKTFFTLCCERKWIATSPATIRKRRTRAQTMGEFRQKSPFTDQELSRILAACDRYSTRTYRAAFDGKDLKDFILLSVYTGLRISDMAVFNVNRLTPEGDVHCRALKNGKYVDTWVPEWAQDIIRKRAAKFGPYIFGARSTNNPQTLANPWQVRLRKLFALCGPWDERASHHRFRHTFVRILLQAGTSVENVALLIGDTEEVVRTCYSKWVPERQAELRKDLQRAFAGKKRLLVVKR